MVTKSSLLTAVVLCKDAAATLPACLASLSFCDQVIVADDGSNDASIEIAKKSGARVITLEPTDSFAHKRNQTLAHIKEGWVLFVDADEYLDDEAKTQIPLYLEKGYEGIFIRRSDIFLGRKLKHGETGSMWLLRLAKVQQGGWQRLVHETWAVSGLLGHLRKGELIHTPHPSIASFIDSINRYTDLEVKQRFQEERPSAVVTWMQLLLYPPVKFIQNYCLKGGFLDGIPGFIHAYIMSLHSLLVRIKILEQL